MNSPSPLVPQGSFLEQKSSGRSRVKVAFFVVVGVHVVAILAALLAQGCRREEAPPPELAPQPAPPVLSEPLLPVESNPPPVLVESPPVLPQPEPTPPPPPVASDYTIARGDTFSTIARKFGVSVKAIQEANPGVDPLRLQIGDKIKIPPPAVAPTGSPPGGAGVAPSGEQIYTVKSGDNLTRIAEQFGTTVPALRSANSLTSDRIKVGQKLKIPTKASAPAGGSPP
ncbi:MAG: LysM peptidoglycan-binding domain-containing protein [Verrucomicrobia bacterium]|nr:LysM peptidoglycan-binding domain-containing protein [Verrucomicrobiota bacterium]